MRATWSGSKSGKFAVDKGCAIPVPDGDREAGEQGHMV